MSVSLSSHWFVPLSDLASGGTLLRADTPVRETDQLVEEGGSFTISLESYCVHGQYDRNSDNDLLVQSWVKYGDEPRIKVINDFRINVASKTVFENLISEYIFSKQDYSDNNRVHLELEIYEVDKGVGTDQSIFTDLKEVTEEFGAAFTPLSRFTKPASVLFKMIGRLQSAKNQNKCIFRSSFDLYRKGGSGETPLRCGAYILFNEPRGGDKAVEGAQYKLGGLKLERAAIQQMDAPMTDDYIVIKIEPEIVKSGGRGSKDLLINQQLAAVLAGLEEDGSTSKRRLHLELLKGWIKDAQKIKDLDYYLQLRNRRDSGTALTSSQEKRFIEIEQRLGSYIQ